jgi:hypothetical protein
MSLPNLNNSNDDQDLCEQERAASEVAATGSVPEAVEAVSAATGSRINTDGAVASPIGGVGRREDPALSLTASPAATVAAVVHQAVSATELGRLTEQDIGAIVAQLADVIRESATIPAAPLFGPFGRFMRANAELAAFLSLLVALAGVGQDAIHNAQPEQPPNVGITVVIKQCGPHR